MKETTDLTCDKTVLEMHYPLVTGVAGDALMHLQIIHSLQLLQNVSLLRHIPCDCIIALQLSFLLTAVC